MRDACVAEEIEFQNIWTKRVLHSHFTFYSFNFFSEFLDHDFPGNDDKFQNEIDILLDVYNECIKFLFDVNKTA